MFFGTIDKGPIIAGETKQGGVVSDVLCPEPAYVRHKAKKIITRNAA